MNQNQERLMAQSRVYAYDTIIGVLNHLPDRDFAEKVRTRDMKRFLQNYQALGQPSITRGAKRILEFINKTDFSEKQIEELAIDRTRILRVPQKGELKPPYESVYCDKEKKDGLLRGLQRAYISSGYIPVDPKDTADFLLIEMDFLKILIEEGQTRQQREFMKEHLGAWAGSYAKAAGETAETGFYKGWMEFLQGFIELEMELLK